jgi:DNA-binding NarL/FixJ family response regulator
MIPMNAASIPVWLIEDNAPFRRAVARVLDQSGDIHCAGAFGRCEDALAALARSPAPRLILLDVGLPGMSGIDGIPLLRQQAPSALILVLTVFEDDEKIFRAICAGACGYLLKTAASEELVQAIREALAGGGPMNARIARRVLEMFARLAPPRGDYGLSPREKEILEATVQGRTKKEIAALLELSFHTVDSHLRHIYEKLEVNTRTGAVAKALKEKLV